MTGHKLLVMGHKPLGLLTTSNPLHNLPRSMKANNSSLWSETSNSSKKFALEGENK